LPDVPKKKNAPSVEGSCSDEDGKKVAIKKGAAVMAVVAALHSWAIKAAAVAQKAAFCGSGAKHDLIEEDQQNTDDEVESKAKPKQKKAKPAIGGYIMYIIRIMSIISPLSVLRLPQFQWAHIAGHRLVHCTRRRWRQTIPVSP
jgi:hypothetical protein